MIEVMLADGEVKDTEMEAAWAFVRAGGQAARALTATLIERGIAIKAHNA